MDLRLDGKVALVTGGSKGIGKAIAAAFASSGADVMISSRKQDQLEAAAAEMTGGGRVEVFAANAGDAEAAQSCVDATVERLGSIDILVNNAATNPYMGPLLGIDESRAAKTVQVNQWGPLMWTKLAWEASMKERGGNVINMASVGGLGTDTSIAYYNITKAALIHMTKQLALEMGPKVRVNAIAPGLVKTDFAKALWERGEEAIAKRHPLGRLGVPEDIAAGAVFLASDAASWITGHTLVIDGGSMVGPKLM